MISIIIPVFNSENTIETLVNNITKVLEDYYQFEVLLINDSSEDDSEKKCKQLVEKYLNVSLSVFIIFRPIQPAVLKKRVIKCSNFWTVGS